MSDVSRVNPSLRLDQIGIVLLVLLARLTPRRHYYPRHLRVMQEVEWERLSPISQHLSFFESVRSSERERLIYFMTTPRTYRMQKYVVTITCLREPASGMLYMLHNPHP